MAAAVALSSRGVGRTAPNPPVGCILVRDGRVVGRGWTQPGGRPHAEAMALAAAGDHAEGATAYVTLEPCAHESTRGPACVHGLIGAGVARVVVAVRDPDPRTDGASLRLLEDAGVETRLGVGEAAAREVMAGFLSRLAWRRPVVTLKLGLSLDGRIAMVDGRSRWITGAAARAHAHLERARHEAIVVGRATFDEDGPRLNVRLPGLESRGPRRFVLTRRPLPERHEGQQHPWRQLAFPQMIAQLGKADHVMIEGGAGAAAAFLREDLVDRLLLYRAPILIGEGRPSIGDIGLESLKDAHGRWRLADARMLGSDRLEVYLRTRNL